MMRKPFFSSIVFVTLPVGIYLFVTTNKPAILQVNFRGSTGYGNYGTTMQSDITDAAHWLVTEALPIKKQLPLWVVHMAVTH